MFRETLTTHQIVNEVGEGPDHGHAGEGNAEYDDVQEADAQDVSQPHSSAVHHSGVGVHLAVRRAHVHDGVCLLRALYLPYNRTNGLSLTQAGVTICLL